MKFVELTDKQRKMILDHLGSHVNDVYHEVNLDILTALYDEESDRYLTLSYYVSPVVTQDSAEIGYILIHGDEVGEFIYSYQTTDTVFLEMCRFYESEQGRAECNALEKKLVAEYALRYEGEPVAYARDYLQWYLKNKMQNGAE